MITLTQAIARSDNSAFVRTRAVARAGELRRRRRAGGHPDGEVDGHRHVGVQPGRGVDDAGYPGRAPARHGAGVFGARERRSAEAGDVRHQDRRPLREGRSTRRRRRTCRCSTRTSLVPRPRCSSARSATVRRAAHWVTSLGRRRARRVPPTHNVDAWFVGYTPQFTAAVWMGNPDGRDPDDEHRRHRAGVRGGVSRQDLGRVHAESRPRRFRSSRSRAGVHEHPGSLHHRNRAQAQHVPPGPATTTTTTIPGPPPAAHHASDLHLMTKPPKTTPTPHKKPPPTTPPVHPATRLPGTGLT